nr:hypothetical protein [Tanacetum cinerariifolium]
MASAINCLANNQKFNFSKYILDNMVKHLEGGVKFLMFLRFVQVFLDKQVEGMAKHKEIYVISSHTKKFFANMKRQGQGFSGNVTPLFKTMMVTAQEEVEKSQEARKEEKAKTCKAEEIKEEKIIKKEVSTVDLVTTASEVVTAASVKDSAALTTATTADVDDELTLEKTLIAIKSAKPEVILIAFTTPRAKGIVFHKQVQAHKPTVSSSKDNGKSKIIEPGIPLKKKDQIALDEEVARKLEAEMRAKIEEDERIAREKDEANRVVIKE